MESAVRNDITENRKPSVFKRFFVLLLVTLLLFAAAGYGGMYVLLKGPSAHAGSQAAAAMAGSSVGSAVLRLFLTDEEIEQRLELAHSDGDNQFSVHPE